jgi:pimeloyl-ACP methyl ester carboxylesterase
MKLENTLAHQVIEFKTAKTETADSISGQISLPNGKAHGWDRDVIIFIYPMFFSNRDSWLVDGQDSSESYWKMMGLLDDALIKENIAVVRFDNPGVYPPSKQCREKIKKNGLSNAILNESCFNDDVMSSLTHKQYLRDIENLISTIEIKLPLAKKRIILMGFSEGGIHIGHLINRLKSRPHGVVMFSSPLESAKTLTKWQLTERLIETIPKFDLNNDGSVTNEEIVVAYKNGVGNFTRPVTAWLSPQGKWDKNNIQGLNKKFTSEYEALVNKTMSVPDDKVKLFLVETSKGVLIPQYTNAFEKLHFLDNLSNFDVLIKSQIPTLLMFGGKDTQIRIDEQLRLSKIARSRGAQIQELVFKDRFHTLSKENDFQMFKPEAIPEISKAVSNFVKTLPK